MASLRFFCLASKQYSSASIGYFAFTTFCGYLILCTNGANGLSNGRPCVRSQDGATGICRPLSECPDIRGDGFNKPARPVDICEAKGSMPVVCCVPKADKGPEQNAIALSGFSGQHYFSEKLTISQRKCKEYADLVYEKQISEETGEIIDRKDRCVKPANPFKSGRVLLGEFPHMTALAVNLTEFGIHYFCGGVLISERYVLTSVGCSKAHESIGKIIYVWLGGVVKDEDSEGARPEVIKVVQIISHPDFEAEGIYFDIALLLLEKAPTLSWRIRPACLSVGNHKEQEFFALGWGKTSSDKDFLSNTLLKVDLLEAPINVCNATYYVGDAGIGIHAASQICAGHPFKKSSLCVGDAGGPLQIPSANLHCMYEIVGISSYGHAKCKTAPNVFSRVSYFLKWIEDVVWPM